MKRRGERDGGPITDPEEGIWRGRKIARRFQSPDGWTVLVGKNASDNDILTFKIGAPRDFWLHIAAGSGSHVVVRNPDKLERMPRETQVFAAGLAARYSKLSGGGKAAVHLAFCAEIKKPRGFPAGKVQLKRYKTVHARPTEG